MPLKLYFNQLDNHLRGELGNTVISGTLTVNEGAVQLPTASSDPSSPANGQIYYNNSTHKLRLYANGAWANLN
jgi:hypothetical protein